MPHGRVEKLKVYNKAVAEADEIFAITERPMFRDHVALRDQLRTSSGRIQAHLQEGSAQSTDKHYAHYVGIACGSAKEMKGHLRRAFCGGQWTVRAAKLPRASVAEPAARAFWTPTVPLSRAMAIASRSER